MGKGLRSWFYTLLCVIGLHCLQTSTHAINLFRISLEKTNDTEVILQCKATALLCCANLLLPSYVKVGDRWLIRISHHISYWSCLLVQGIEGQEKAFTAAPGSLLQRFIIDPVSESWTEGIDKDEMPTINGSFWSRLLEHSNTCLRGAAASALTAAALSGVRFMSPFFDAARVLYPSIFQVLTVGLNDGFNFVVSAANGAVQVQLCSSFGAGQRSIDVLCLVRCRVLKIYPQTSSSPSSMLYCSAPVRLCPQKPA